jgi:hypothetical protein
LCQIQWHIINWFPWTSKASIFRCFCISTHLWCFCFIQSAPGCVQGVGRQSGWYCHLARVSKPCEAQLKGQKDVTFRTPWVGSLGARYLQDSQAPQKRMWQVSQIHVYARMTTTEFYHLYLVIYSLLLFPIICVHIILPIYIYILYNYIYT